MERWVKLYDKFTQWEWFDNSQMVHLYLYLILKANAVESSWHGERIARGQLVTTLSKICSDTHISMQSVRTCLKRLQDTGEIIKDANRQRTLITICKYEDYQQSSKPDKDTARKEPSCVSDAAERPSTPAKVQPEQIKADMISDKSWGELMCMRYHFSRDDLLKLIDAFWIDVRCRGKTHYNESDAKNHFNSWIMVRQEIKRKIQNEQRINDKRRGLEIRASTAQDYKTAF